MHITANIDTLNTDSDFKPYLFTALDSSLASWSAPVPLGFGPNYIDTFVMKVGATYHAFAKNETTRYCEHATSSNLTGPWTFVGTGNWAGWGSGMEGPAVVQLGDGTWRIFMDGQGSTPFVTATSSDLSTWSSWVALPDGLESVVRHGTVIRDVAVGSASVDGGVLGDAATLGDAELTGDAEPPLDGRTAVDSSALVDSRTPTEEGPSTDAAEGADMRALADGGVTVDATTDVATRDAGLEASSNSDSQREDGTVSPGLEASADEGGWAAPEGGAGRGNATDDGGIASEDNEASDIDSSGGAAPRPAGCSCRMAGDARERPGGSALLFLLLAAATCLRRPKRESHDSSDGSLRRGR